MPDMMITVKGNNIGRAADQADRLHAGFFSQPLAVTAITRKECLRFFSIKHQNPFLSVLCNTVIAVPCHRKRQRAPVS